MQILNGFVIRWSPSDKAPRQPYTVHKDGRFHARFGSQVEAENYAHLWNDLDALWDDIDSILGWAVA